MRLIKRQVKLFYGSVELRYNSPVTEATLLQPLVCLGFAHVDVRLAVLRRIPRQAIVTVLFPPVSMTGDYGLESLTTFMTHGWP